MDKKPEPRTPNPELKILAVVPSFNEDEVIGKTIEALKSITQISEVVVADDCSTDNTVQAAKQAGISVIEHPENYGKGLSLTQAIKQLDISSYDGIIFADADLGSSATQFKSLIKKFEKDKNQLIIAGFGKPSKKGGFGLVKGLAKRAINKYGGNDLNTPLSGQRLLSVEALKEILPLASGFGVEVDMTIKALKKGIAVKEVTTSMSHNETGRDVKGFWHRGKQFKDVFKVVIKNW